MSKITWRKSASKDVRPFFGAATLESCVDAAEIRLFEDGEFSAETTFVVEPADATRLFVAIKPNIDASSLSNELVKKHDLVLAVSVVQPFLKKTLVVGRYPASKALPEEIPIGAEVLEQLGGGTNAVIEVALCLLRIPVIVTGDSGRS